MRVLRLAALALALPGAALAAAPPSTDGGPAPGMTPCDCVTSARCWPVAKSAFALIVTAKKKEIEGSMPGRFRRGARVEVLRKPDKDGHFLRAVCGPKKIACESVRDDLERRLAVSSLTQSISTLPEAELFDAQTWAVTKTGEKVLAEAKQCRPGIWSELSPMLLSDDVWK